MPVMCPMIHVSHVSNDSCQSCQSVMSVSHVSHMSLVIHVNLNKHKEHLCCHECICVCALCFHICVCVHAPCVGECPCACVLFVYVHVHVHVHVHVLTHHCCILIGNDVSVDPWPYANQGAPHCKKLGSRPDTKAATSDSNNM